MSTIKQFCYYGEGDSRNIPNDLTFSTVISPNWITSPVKIEEYGEIIYLKISTLGGIRVQINESQPIEVTNLETFELQHNNFEPITSIQFVNNRFLRRLRDKNHEGDFLIVDVIYSQEVKDETDSNIVSLLRQ